MCNLTCTVSVFHRTFSLIVYFLVVELKKIENLNEVINSFWIFLYKLSLARNEMLADENVALVTRALISGETF